MEVEEKELNWDDDDNFEEKCYWKKCSVCGDKFPFYVAKKDNAILTQCFHTTFARPFMGWGNEVIDMNAKDLFSEDNTDIVFKNGFWEAVGFTGIQRTIVYWIWEHTLGKKKLEYFECPSCYQKWDEEADTEEENGNSDNRIPGPD